MNKITINNRYLIPWINDIHNQIKHTKLFSKSGLESSYHSVLIKQVDVWKITFKSKEGIFDSLVIPFIFTNDPTTFVMMIDDMLRLFTRYL